MNLPKRCPEPLGFSGNMESWEFERNNSANVKFQDNDFLTQAFDSTKQEYYPAWYDDWEARFPSDEWRDTAKLYEFITWVKSTWRDQATNETLSEPVTYRIPTLVTVNPYPSDSSYTVVDEVGENNQNTGMKLITFTKDTPAYRLTKFRAEASDYVEIQSAAFYYIYTEAFLMIDSRAKNMFIGFNGSAINDANRAMDRKVTFQPYDMDTALATNNSGVLMFGYYLEDTDTVSSIISGGDSGGSNAPVYNAQDSVFWVNWRDAFRAENTSMYRTLRTGNLFSYAGIEAQFDEHQSHWCEAIFNEDAYIKYITPLIDPVTYDESTEQYIRTDRYLTMVQGSKTEQRKWWLSNRFKYLDSKYVTGDASANIINMRLFNSGTLTITPAIDMYAAVSFGGGTTVSQQRTTANTPVSFTYTASSGVTEMETWIYSADMITGVGDLSVFYPNELDFSKATKLKSLKIGDSAQNYSNANLTTIDVRNSSLLESIDCRNCPNLAITVNLENSPRLREAYFDGTAITGLDLADGGALETLSLPPTITTLTLLNLNKLTTLTLESVSNVSRVMLASVPSSLLNPVTLLSNVRANAQVNIQGMYLELANAAAIEDFLDLLDTMQGVSREKNSNGDWIYHDFTDAQVSGEIHTTALTGNQIASYNQRYPYLRITADYVESTLTYKSYDGTTTLKTVSCYNGEPQDTPPTIPVKADSSDGHYSYTGIGWNTEMDSEVADPSAITNVIADRTVYAAYSKTVKTYTVTWKNGNTTIETDTNVPWGTVPTYNGTTPQDAYGNNSTGWEPTVAAITGDTVYTASFKPTYTATFVRNQADGGGTLYTQSGVLEGNTPVYGGSTPTTTKGSATDFEFTGWSPALAPISANTTYTAQFRDKRSIVVQYLMRTITNYESTTNTVKFGEYGFYNATSLETATAPVALVEQYAFQNCSNLTTVDLSATSGAVTINASAFSSNSKLDAVIIRSSTMATLANISAFTGTKIASKNGAIYVPSNMADTYKANSNWANFIIASIDQYPLTEFSTITDSWDEIIANDNYATDYKIGDTKIVDLGSMGKQYMELVAFDTDDKADGSGKARMTWIARDIITTHAMNSTQKTVDGITTYTAGGWENSDMRAYLKDTVKPLIPEVVRNAIVPVTKVSSIYTTAIVKDGQTTTDDVWIPSSHEIFNGSNYETTGATYNTRFASNASCIKYNSAGSADYWWLRSASNTNNFRCVSNSGYEYGINANSSYGVVLGFCI